MDSTKRLVVVPYSGSVPASMSPVELAYHLATWAVLCGGPYDTEDWVHVTRVWLN